MGNTQNSGTQHPRQPGDQSGGQERGVDHALGVEHGPALAQAAPAVTGARRFGASQARGGWRWTSPRAEPIAVAMEIDRDIDALGFCARCPVLGTQGAGRPAPRRSPAAARHRPGQLVSTRPISAPPRGTSCFLHKTTAGKQLHPPTGMPGQSGPALPRHAASGPSHHQPRLRGFGSPSGSRLLHSCRSHPRIGLRVTSM